MNQSHALAFMSKKKWYDFSQEQETRRTWRLPKARNDTMIREREKMAHEMRASKKKELLTKKRQRIPFLMEYRRYVEAYRRQQEAQ